MLKAVSDRREAVRTALLIACLCSLASLSGILLTVRITDKQLHRACEVLILGLILITALWRGGKSLDATWMLATVAGIVTLYWYWKGWIIQEHREVPAVIWITVILFLLWSMLSFLFSTTQNYGLDELMRDSGCALLFFWIIRQGKDTRGDHLPFIEKMILTIAVATFLASLFGLFVYILQPVNRFVGTFFDYRFHTDYWPNAWAQYVLLTWPIALHVALKKHVSVLWGFLALGFILGCLLLSYSRGAFIAFIGQIALLGLLRLNTLHAEFLPHWKLKIGQRGKKMIFSIVLLCATALITFVMVNGFRSELYEVQDVSDKVTFSSAEGVSSASERSQFWSQAFQLMMERPLFGWGPYSFRFVQPLLQTDILATSDHPHNIFLKLGMERGVPTMIFFTAILAIVFLRRRMLKLTTESFPHALLAVAILGTLAHNLIDYNLQFVAIALPFWLILGLIVRDSCREDGPQLHRRVVRLIDVALGVLLLLIVILEGRTLFLSSLGRHAQAGGRQQDALIWYDRASQELFSRDLHLSRTQLLIENNRIEEAQDALDQYFARNTQDPRAWIIRGDLALAAKDRTAALTAYEKAEQGLRYNNLTPLRAVLTLLIESKDTNALDLRKDEIFVLLERYAAAIERNTHFIALGQNVEEFLKISEMLGNAYPDIAPKLQILSAKVDRHAKEERAKVKGRSPGYLW